MPTFTVLAGDFPKYSPTVPFASVEGPMLMLPRPGRRLWLMLDVASPREPVHASMIRSLEVVGQASGTSFGGAAAGGLAGGLLLGPVGVIAGALAGGSKDAVTFQLTLRDGRRLLGSASSTAFQALQAAMFECRGRRPGPVEPDRTALGSKVVFTFLGVATVMWLILSAVLS